MKKYLHSIIHWVSTAIPAAFILFGLNSTAQTYNWLSWDYTRLNPVAVVPGFGCVTVSTTVPDIRDMAIGFRNVSFMPTEAPAVGLRCSGGWWTNCVDFTAMSSTEDLVIGIGNFGHGESYPGYRLEAQDSAGLPMQLDSFKIIGSFDHAWTKGLSWPTAFNDDVTLNPESGVFEVTTISGDGDADSDILLFSLPPKVGKLIVSTIGPSGRDTLNVLVGTASPELKITSLRDEVVVTWPSTTVNHRLESTSNISDPLSWQPEIETNLQSGIFSVTNTTSAQTKFYRLKPIQ